MVITHFIRDIVDSLPDNEPFTLPVFKQNGLIIEYSSNSEHGTDETKTTYSGKEPPLPFADSEVFSSNIISHRRLTALHGDCKAVYEVTFDVKGSNFNFKAGDTIGVIPHNNESDVMFIIDHLNLTHEADLPYSLYLDTSVKGVKIPPHVPVQSTLRNVLTHCLDFRSVLKKLLILALSKYTKDEKERKVLEYLCSKEGSTAYTTHILNKNLCLLDIFSIFKSCKPPIEVALANLPRLLPRPYSIVNTGLKNNKIIKICFSVMTINNRKGLTTGWLENIISKLSISNEKCQKKVPIYLRKNMNLYALPEDVETPLILIGPGTGVSPFIGFLEEREYIREKYPDIILGDAYLFFGCRNPDLDFIYKEELDRFISRGVLEQLFTAYSRVENNGIKYIQDALSQNAEFISALVNTGAAVYVCGDLNTMAAEVKDIFIESFVKYDDISHEEAQTKMSKMIKDKRYLVDAWS